MSAKNLALATTLGAPAPLWRFFAELSSIPRPSKKEDRVITWLRAFVAARPVLTMRCDAVGNAVITRPGALCGALAPPVIVQGHLDMVTQKTASSSHNFDVDPIELRLDGAWLKATDTTLGADNGIGVAAALALLDAPLEGEGAVPMPPLECLFTVDEETGLTGAKSLDVAALELSAATLINLDTEEWGAVCVGCAGGGQATTTLPLARDAAVESDAAATPFVLRVGGLLGGHSGVQIHEDRANALVLLARVLAELRAATPALQLVSIEGGDKHNAIPRDSSAVVRLPSAAAAAALEPRIAALRDALAAEYQLDAPTMTLRLEPCDAASLAPLREADATRLLSFLRLIPVGALKKSHALPGVVETSNSLAIVRVGATAAVVTTSTRSSVAAALDDVRGRIAALAALCGGDIELVPSYPGWNPAPDSPLLAIVQSCAREVLGKDAAVEAIHAGLECGLLLEKLPWDTDAISFGPTIVNAHSPKESCEVATVEPFWRLLTLTLAKLAEARA
jgi:dipeptidase D